MAKSETADAFGGLGSPEAGFIAAVAIVWEDGGGEEGGREGEEG